MSIKSPYPYFGGKSRVAKDIWDKLGRINYYIEPFFGSGAVLLGSPYIPPNEIVNDIYGMITNFWRSVKYWPKKTARYADQPMNEIELEATQNWLIPQKDNLEKLLREDLKYCDPEIAGRWVWGVAQWLGDNWCSDKTLQKRPSFTKAGIHRSSTEIQEYFQFLSQRLRNTIICCGDWERVVCDFITTKNVPIGIFLDPPYSSDAGRENNLYIKDDLNVSKQVYEWCIANGNKPNFRIAFCGYSTEYKFPSDWVSLNWKSCCAWSNHSLISKGSINSNKEVIWFSPHCRKNSKQIMDLI